MNPASFFRALVLLGLILGLHRASGAQINWGSTRLATNYTSDLRPLGQDGAFTFEVGAFAEGFAPTADNADEWAANWIAGGSGSYNSTLAFVTGSVVGSESIPSGAKGYIWGFDSREAGEVEWILVTDAGWAWGAGGSQPVDWTVGSAGESVVGTLGSGTMPFHMQTAALNLSVPGGDAQAWLAEHFAGETESPMAAWDADADHDGIANALEFAFGTSPREANSAVRVTAVPADTSAGRVMSIVFDGLPTAGVVLSYEVSTDLQNWSPADDSVSVRAEAGRWIIEDTVPTAAGRRFFRVSVDL